MLAVLIITFGILSRIVIHTPNFTPILSLVLFGGMYLKGRQGLWVPLVLMMISDIIIGFHDTLFFTWGTIVLIALIGVWLRSNKSIRNILLTSIASSLLFFIITNLAAWPTLYPKTWEGLQTCFIAALPFYRNTLVSTALYTALLFGSYEWIAGRIKHTELSKVLLVS